MLKDFCPSLYTMHMWAAVKGPIYLQLLHYQSKNLDIWSVTVGMEIMAMKQAWTSRLK